MAKQNNNENAAVYNSASYKHGNLMMISTVIGMCTLLIVMLLSTAFKSINSVNLAFGVSKVISALFFVAFIVSGILSIKKDRLFIEYCIYALVMSLGFLSLCGTPFFLPSNVAFINAIFSTRYTRIALISLNILYLLWSFLYHGIKADNKK